MNEAREELTGWVWVGLGGLATILLPFWALLTAVVIQLNPDLAGLEVVVDPEGMELFAEGPSRLVVLMRGAARAGGLLMLGLPLVGLLTAMGWAGSVYAGVRGRRERDDLDEAVRDMAVLRDVQLRVSTSETAAPREASESGGARESTPAPAAVPADPGPNVAVESLVAAAPGPRVVAFLIDAVISWGVILPGLAMVLFLPEGATDSLWGAVGVASVAVLTVAALVGLAFGQMSLLGGGGQSVGKRVMGLRIVEADGAPAGVVQGLLVRQVLFGTLCVIVPIIGWFIVPLVDGALVFSADGLTLHDRLAGTRVVRA